MSPCLIVYLTVGALQIWKFEKKKILDVVYVKANQIFWKVFKYFNTN